MRAGTCGLVVAVLMLGMAVKGEEIHFHCQNNAEDASRLNATIAKSQAGDIVRIHGACQLTETIILLGDRSYVGDSRTGTVLRQADDANLAALLASDSWWFNQTGAGRPVRIAHLTLDGNRKNNRGTCNFVIRSWLTVIEDVVSRNAPVDGIRLTSVGRDGKTRLTSTLVNGRISNCFINASGGDGIHVVDPVNAVTDWDLADCWIANSGGSAVRMDNAAGWKLVGNHLYGVQEHAIYAHRCYGTTIADNYIEDFGRASGDTTWYGIACTVQGGAASVIKDNKVFRFGGQKTPGLFVFIGVPRVNYGFGVLNVTGNVIRGTGTQGETGISYEVGGGEGLEVLSRNHISGVERPRLIGEKVKLADDI